MNRLPLCAFVDLWERPDCWELAKEGEEKKLKDNNTQEKKNRTKVWCGKVNYNQLVIVMLLK